MSDLITPTPETLSLAEIQRQAADRPTKAKLWAQVASAKIKIGGRGSYPEIEIRDATGGFKLRVWDRDPANAFARALKDGQAIELDGTFSRGEFGMESNDWQGRLLEPGEEASLYVGPASLVAKQEVDWGTIVNLVCGMQDPHFKRACEILLEKRGDEFRRAAAARGNHHARRGGLVEHTAFMMRSAKVIAEQYAGEINVDLLLAGTLFHDAGKIVENQYQATGFEMPFTLRAELLGHIAIGFDLIGRIWTIATAENVANGGAAFPEDKLLHLQHLILSHHGELQYGSPVTPKSLEGVILHYVDQIDAKLEMMRGGRLVQKELAPTIYERMWPLPGNFVATPLWQDPPLPKPPVAPRRAIAAEPPPAAPAVPRPANP